MNIAKTFQVVFLVCFAISIHSTAQSSDKTPTAGSLIGKEAGSVREDNGLAMKFVWCPAGDLTMEQIQLVDEPVADGAYGKEGSRRVEKRVPIKVSLSHGFWMGRCEVTQAEWRRVMQTTPWNDFRSSIPDVDDAAVNCVNWFDAMEFCNRLSRQEREAGRLPAGWEYTLPTEAQWEYACRAQSSTQFSFGDDESEIGEVAWYFYNSTTQREPYVHRVGQKKPNAWGLFDTYGNVCELCRDFYHSTLPGGTDPHAENEGWNRVMRGGCFNDIAASCRSSAREGFSPIPRGNCIGLRVALCQGDAESTAARLQKLKEKVPVLVETSESGLAMAAEARKAGAFPGDTGDVLAALIKIHRFQGRVGRDYGRGDCPINAVYLSVSDQLRDEDLEFLKVFKQIRTLDLSRTSVTDACLEHVTQLPELRLLGLEGTKVTDAGMHALRKCRNLQELFLDITTIGDDGLSELGTLPSLKVLTLRDAPVTDSGLQQLAQTETLIDLDLSGTQVTQAGVDKLKIARPNLMITLPKPDTETKPAVSPLIGKTSESWTTADLAGKEHSLQDYRGKVVILDFWFRECVWCLRAMPQVNQVSEHFENQPVVVFGASVDEKEGDALTVVETMKLTYPVLKAAKMQERYEVEGFPTLLVIDQQGIIRHIHRGYSPKLREEIIEVVDGLLKRE